jgi:hypothetical protein
MGNEMRNKYLAALILCSALLLCISVVEQSSAHDASQDLTGRAQSSSAEELFTATVKSGEARFTLPVPGRSEWEWRKPETADRAQEYRMGVSVKNEGTGYTFGFYLWKRAGATPKTGSFSDLINAGQKSVFERKPSSRGFTIIQDAKVGMTPKGDRLIIEIDGRKNVQRLFSSRPAEVTFKITVPGEAPSTKVVPVRYEN